MIQVNYSELSQTNIREGIFLINGKIFTINYLVTGYDKIMFFPNTMWFPNKTFSIQLLAVE